MMTISLHLVSLSPSLPNTHHFTFKKQKQQQLKYKPEREYSENSTRLIFTPNRCIVFRHLNCKVNIERSENTVNVYFLHLGGDDYFGSWWLRPRIFFQVEVEGRPFCLDVTILTFRLSFSIARNAKKK